MCIRDRGDTVTVQQGDVELALPVGVTVENKGEGEIVVNGEAVEPGETVVTEEEPQPEVKDVYYKDAATGVILNTDTTKVPEGSYLLVKPVAETEQAHADAKEALKDKAGRFVLYDITLVNAAGEPIQPAGDVLIGIPTPDGYDTSKLAVHRINEDKTTVYISLSGAPVTSDGSAFTSGTFVPVGMLTITVGEFYD